MSKAVFDCFRAELSGGRYELRSRQRAVLPSGAEPGKWYQSGSMAVVWVATHGKCPALPAPDSQLPHLAAPAVAKKKCLCQKHAALVNVSVEIQPDDQCVMCAEKHFSAALAMLREPGYTVVDRALIMGDLYAASRHTVRDYPDLAEEFRSLRHLISFRARVPEIKLQHLAAKVDAVVCNELGAGPGELGVLKGDSEYSGRIYVISNCPYPRESRLSPDADDLLVFLNKAASLPYYAEHPAQKVVFHRSDAAAYGTKNPGIGDIYCYAGGNSGKVVLPSKLHEDLASNYDWHYPAPPDGLPRSPSTGYIVVHFLRRQFPKARIVLVNFGFGATNSTWRSPCHNWYFEAAELAAFDHMFIGR